MIRNLRDENTKLDLVNIKPQPTGKTVEALAAHEHC